jgi:hypothetical protein
VCVPLPFLVPFPGLHLLGSLGYAIGIVFRFVYRDDFNSIAIFIIMDFFVVLSPCAFIASVYSVLGQLATRYDAEDLVPIQAARIAKVFIWSGQSRGNIRLPQI